METNQLAAPQRSRSLWSLVSSFTPAPAKRFVRKASWWKQRFLFRPYIMTKVVRGDSFPFYIGDSTAEAWYGGGNNRTPELGFIRDQMLSAGDLVFDVGSHHGLFAVAMGRRGGQVIAIEPNPHNVAILRKNIALNSLCNVTVCPAAAGDATGHIHLPLDSSEGGVLEKDFQRLATTAVPIVRLDDLAARHGFPALIKIDVEGFEYQALRGATEILARRPKIAIEIHTSWIYRYASSVADVLSLLAMDQYEVWVMPHGSPALKRWEGEDLNSYPPPKFNLFMLPKAASSAV